MRLYAQKHKTHHVAVKKFVKKNIPVIYGTFKIDFSSRPCFFYVKIYYFENISNRNKVAGCTLKSEQKPQIFSKRFHGFEINYFALVFRSKAKKETREINEINVIAVFCVPFAASLSIIEIEFFFLFLLGCIFVVVEVGALPLRLPARFGHISVFCLINIFRM